MQIFMEKESRLLELYQLMSMSMENYNFLLRNPWSLLYVTRASDKYFEPRVYPMGSIVIELSVRLLGHL